MINIIQEVTYMPIPVITIYLFSLIDITITYYYFFLMDKKECCDIRQEKGLIARIIMEKLGRTPWTFLLDYILSALVITFMFWAAPIYEIKRDIFFCFLGVYMMILWMNTYHIIKAKMNWNNERYWEIERELKKIIIR